MRVLMLSWEYPPHLIGGLGKHVVDLTPALARAGVEVHVFTPQLNDGAPYEVTPDRVHVHRVATPAIVDYGYLPLVQQANRAIERAARALHADSLHFDIIHAHDWLMASAGIALKHAWRMPLISTIHATERGRGQGNLLSELSRQINDLEWSLTYESWRVITCSHFMAMQVHDYFRVPLDKIDVVPNGVNIRPNPFGSGRERRAFRRRFVADSQPLAFYVGRIVYEKGLHILLDAWPMVRSTVSNARLLVAGAGANLDAIKARAWDLGLTHDVIFTGFISDEERDKLYHIADVAIFPSIYEPFGIVALEAMAAHCPVVATDTGGLSEVVKLHETGLKVIPNDPGSLAWGIVHSLKHPEWARVRARNAYREVRFRYSWDTIAAATVEVYRRAYREWDTGSWGKELAHRPAE